MQRQAVQRVFEEVGVGVFVRQLGQADGVHLAVVQAEGHHGFLAAIDGDQVFIAGPPQQAVGGQALFTGLRVEVQPVVAVEAAQPQFRGLRLVGHQTDGVDLLYRHVGDGQQQLDDLGLVRRRGVAGQQQLHIVVVEVVGALDGFTDKGFDVGRVLADRGQQGFGGDLFRAFHGDAVAEGRAFDLDLFAAVALGQHQAVIEGLVALGPARRPGDLAVAVDAVDAHPVVVRDKALIEADEVAAQGRHEHLDLDRVFRVGDELDLGVDVPQVVGGIFGDGNPQHEDLIGGDRNAQHHQQGDQDFQVQGQRAHSVYSAVLSVGGAGGFACCIFKTGVDQRIKAFQGFGANQQRVLECAAVSQVHFDAA